MGYFRRLHWKMVPITLLSILVMGFSLAMLERIDLGTDPYAFMNFSIADKLGWSLGNWNMPLRIVLMLGALAIFCFSAAVYMSTGLGTSPCDAVSVILAHKLHKWPFKLVRFLYDLVTLLIGVLFGGKLQIVTVLTVLFLGVTVELVAQKIFKKKM